MPAFHESKVHGTRGFPYIVYPGVIPEYRCAMPHHWHEEMEIVYVSQGPLIVSVGNTEFVLKDRDIVLVHPQTIHSIRQYDDFPARYDTILFRFSMLESGAEDTCRDKYLEPICSRRLLMPERLTSEHPLHTAIEPLIRKLLIDPHHQRFHDELLIKARVFEILYLVYPYCQPADKSTAYEDIIYEKLKRSLRYLEENYADRITLEKMASLCNYTKGYYAKLFKQLTGITFTQYLKNYRLETAADRIRNEKTKISEIAVSCGFSNLSYFSRAFCERFHTTPSDYRKAET